MRQDRNRAKYPTKGLDRGKSPMEVKARGKARIIAVEDRVRGIATGGGRAKVRATVAGGVVRGAGMVPAGDKQASVSRPRRHRR